ncbi:MAG: hypothetical protein IPO78_17705 [Saprospiraceae bacterium]|nr:hypothetical protein [Saprospiraceae bacterium]
MTNSEKLLLVSIKYLGTKESLTGWDENIQRWILASCKSLGIADPMDDSQFAWCGCFISNMLIESGIWNANKKHIVAARLFLNEGQPVTVPLFGDIVILERGPGKGHIGIYINSTSTRVKLLSGNSQDSVTINDFDKSRVLGYRRF